MPLQSELEQHPENVGRSYSCHFPSVPRRSTRCAVQLQACTASPVPFQRQITRHCAQLPSLPKWLAPKSPTKWLAPKSSARRVGGTEWEGLSFQGAQGAVEQQVDQIFQPQQADRSPLVVDESAECFGELGGWHEWHCRCRHDWHCRAWLAPFSRWAPFSFFVFPLWLAPISQVPAMGWMHGSLPRWLPHFRWGRSFSVFLTKFEVCWSILKPAVALY